jgi:DNA modification methylase
MIADRIKTFKRVKVADLIDNPKNWRKHPDAQRNALGGLLESVGWADAVLARETPDGLMLIDGHLRKELAADSKVPVLVLDVTEAEADLILATHDPLTSMAETDQALLDELVQGLDIDNDETQKMLDELASDPVAEAEEEDLPEVPEKPTTTLGDLFELGSHRLLCGDCTSADNVARLMDGAKASLLHADPPYGVSYQSNMRTASKKFEVLKNDDTFLTDWIPVTDDVSDGWVFVWTSWKVVGKWIEYCSEFGDMTNVVVWDKGGGGIGDLEGTFLTDYELALVYNRGAKIRGKRIGSVWSVNRDSPSTYEHPTQKPAALAAMAIQHTTDKRDIILDPFLGSGTTLIAAEQLGRKCYGMEISPAYCDVIIQRWENLTGNKARKVK